MTPPDSNTDQQGAAPAAATDFQRPDGAPLTAAERREQRQQAAKNRAAVAGLTALADRQRDARNWEGARKGYEEVLAVDPSLNHIWMQLGHARKESGDHAGAELAYREALKLKPSDADGHLQLGHLHKIRGQLAEKMLVFDQVNELINRIKHGARG